MNESTSPPPYGVVHWEHIFAEPNYKDVPPLCITVNDRAATRQAIIKGIQENNTIFLERSSWGANKNKAENMVDDWDYKMIAIHHAGRSYSCGAGKSAMVEAQDMQMKDNGFDDFAYHYAVDCSGVVYEGRDIRFKGQHLYKYNTGAIGIVLLENLTDPEEKLDTVGVFMSIGRKLGSKPPVIPEVQKNALKLLIKILGWYFRIEKLGGHREFPNQTTGDARICPGNHGIALVKELRNWSGLSNP